MPVDWCTVYLINLVTWRTAAPPFSRPGARAAPKAAWPRKGPSASQRHRWHADAASSLARKLLPALH